ncbi:serine hydrolase domain-containing protein [Nocardiopsis eucommiae]|uniref:serine hydrolase domain-containing protein n=1 Tax=Nocardiopsis eucommiae TaxID=2831970 RepID=UPI003D717804
MADQPRTPIDPEHWRARLAVLSERHGVPGAQLGLLRIGADAAADEAVEVAHGVLNAATGHAVDTGSVFQIGSVTKVWTATVVMGLVDEGLLTPDTPVAELLPELRLPDPARRVTVRHLLNHTSGIDGDVFTDTGRGDDALERYVALLADTEPVHPVGAAFSYCNAGYVVLGRIVERLTGLTWDRAVRERLFAPLGMTRACTLPEEALLHGAAVGHVEGLPDPEVAPVWGIPRSMGPAGTVLANAGDVLRFAAAHLRRGLGAEGDRVLSEASARAMGDHEVTLPDPHTLGDSWGLGWIRFGWDGRLVLGHDGNTVGQSAFLRLLPDAGFAVVLLTNGGRTRDLYQELYGEVFRDLTDVRVPTPLGPDPAPDPGPRPVADEAPVSAVYESTAQRLEILGEGERRTLRVIDRAPLPGVDPDPVEEWPLLPAGGTEGQFVFRPEGRRTWVPVRIHALETGEEYLYLGGRAVPRVRAGNG